MKKKILIVLLFQVQFISLRINGQIGISATPGFLPNSKAMLDISSTNKGVLLPRMTSAQRTGITPAPQGLAVFDTQTNSFWYHDGVAWKEMNSNTSSTAPYYPAVTICCQSWMTKNLEVTTYRNGDPIPQVTDPTAWQNLTTGAWCYYNNDPNNGPIYGKLYNWYAVNDPRGLAPQGWHIPTHFELTTLSNCLGGDNNTVISRLKEFGTARWASPNTATNSSGFTALPGGFKDVTAGFTGLGNSTVFWSSTSTGNIGVLYIDTANNPPISTSDNPKYGNSVRCIKD